MIVSAEKIHYDHRTGDYVCSEGVSYLPKRFSDAVQQLKDEGWTGSVDRSVSDDGERHYDTFYCTKPDVPSTAIKIISVW